MVVTTNVVKKGQNTAVIAVEIVTDAGETHQTAEINHNLGITPDFVLIQDIIPTGSHSLGGVIRVQYIGDIGTDAKIDADETIIKVYVPGHLEQSVTYKGLFVVGRFHSIVK